MWNQGFSTQEKSLVCDATRLRLQVTEEHARFSRESVRRFPQNVRPVRRYSSRGVHVRSLPAIYGLRLTVLVLRLTAHGLRLTAYGLRLPAYDLRLYELIQLSFIRLDRGGARFDSFRFASLRFSNILILYRLARFFSFIFFSSSF